jgi:cyanophycinase-like exopeptidase
MLSRKIRNKEIFMDITGPGTVALVGAGEYLPAIAPVDKMLLERVAGTPRVVVLPTAAAPDGPGVAERWAKMGVDHFSQLGATVEPVMLLRREDADNSEIVSRIAAANFVYLSGGKPRYLLETLQGTASWRAMLDVLAAGGVVAGCSAGAMVLGGELFDFPQLWRTLPALGLVPGIAVIPHFDEIPSLLTNISSLAGRNLTVVGIDGSTALTRSNSHWHVYGRGGVTVFTERHKARYVSGEQVPLPVS